MRTKTLLLGVTAAIAACLTTAQAQTVYSQNVVGYVNVTVPAHSFAELANQLQNGSDVNQSNNDLNAILATGLISSPNSPGSSSNSVYYQFTTGGYVSYYYYNSADANTAGNNFVINGTTPGWYDGGGNPESVTLKQGSSGFLQNVFTTPITVTLVGTVLQGTNVVTVVPKGFSLLAIPQPISTNIDVAGYGLPDGPLCSAPGSPGAGTNDVYYQYTTGGYVPYYYYNTSDANTAGNNFLINNTTPGWYDGGGNSMGPSANPTAAQGFVFYHFGSSFNWTNTFQVQ